MTNYKNDSDKKDKGYTFSRFHNNRYICDVLEAMRKCVESLNFSPLLSLIEEAQIMANRMESGLSDKRDLTKLNSEMKKAKKAYKQLEEEYRQLSGKVKELKKK